MTLWRGTEGKSGAEASKAYVTFLFTEVDFLQAIDAGLD